MKIITFVAIPLVALSTSIDGQTAEDYTELLASFTTLSSSVRPTFNLSSPTRVNVTFHLLSIGGFDFINQRLTTSGYLDVSWTNEYTRWNPGKWGGIGLVYLPPDKHWRPRLTVMNTLKDLKPIGEEYKLLLSFADGYNVWYPAERFETVCQVDVTYFPFDMQVCSWSFFSYGEDVRTIDLRSREPTINLDSYEKNGEWEVVSTLAVRKIRTISGIDFAFLDYKILLRRRPSLLVLTVLLPVTLLAFINVFVFTIPSEAGERLAYSMTALLSFGVFMNFILDSMPSSTESLSIVSVYLSSLLMLSAVYVLLCILSLRLFHRDSSKHPVPGLLQTVVVWLELIVCLDPPSKTNKVGVVNNRMDTAVATEPANNKEAMKTRDLSLSTHGKIRARLEKGLGRQRKISAYTNPEDMTWPRVSRTVDKLLFRVFFLIVLASTIAIWVMVSNNYFSNNVPALS